MSLNIEQIYTLNPATSVASTDLFYLGRSPYGTSDDYAITGANLLASAMSGAVLLAPSGAQTITGFGLTVPGLTIGTSALTLGGALTTSGAFSSTFTMTGATNVTFPTSGTLATTATASGIINTGTINDLAYYAATGTTLSGLTTADNGVLVTSASGVPSISSTLPASLNVPIPNIIDSSNNTLLSWVPGVTPTGYLEISNGSITPSFAVAGSATNYNMGFFTKGTGTFNFTQPVSTGPYMTFEGGGGLAAAFTFSGGTPNFTFPSTSGTIALTSGLPTPAALTEGNDTNVTLTLGGTPSTALLQATSITAGWSGTLAVGRGGLGIGTTPTNGQIPIGNGTNYTAATLTAGTGVTITNASGGITVAANGASPWVDETGSSVAMTTNTGYTSDDGASLVTFSLPTTSAIGDFVEVNGKGSGLWTITQASGQQIHFGSLATTSGAGGSLSSILQYDNVRLRCITANTIWTVVSSQDNLTVV